MVNNITLGRPVDMCTKQGVTGGDTLTNYWPEGTAAPLGSCLKDTDCGSDTLCSMASNNTQELCTCSYATGVDTCVTYGRCMPTPCATCQTCYNAVQSYITQLDGLNATEVASRFEAHCINNMQPAIKQLTETECRKVAEYIRAPVRGVPQERQGYAGRRPGVLCSMLGQCRSDLPASCSLTSRGRSGNFDSCTAEGVEGGSPLEGIRTEPGDCPLHHLMVFSLLAGCLFYH